MELVVNRDENGQFSLIDNGKSRIPGCYARPATRKALSRIQ